MNQASPLRIAGNTQLPKVKTGNRKAVQQVYSKLNVKPCMLLPVQALIPVTDLPMTKRIIKKERCPMYRAWV